MITVRPPYKLDEVLALVGPDAVLARTFPVSAWSEPGSIGLVVADAEDKVVGAVLLATDKCVGPCPLSHKLLWLYVQPAHRRQGFARALLHKASELAVKAGADHINVALHPRCTEVLDLFHDPALNRFGPYVVHLTYDGMRGTTMHKQNPEAV